MVTQSRLSLLDCDAAVLETLLPREVAMVTEQGVVVRRSTTEQEAVASATAVAAARGETRRGVEEEAASLSARNDVEGIASRASDLAFELGRASTRPLETVVGFWKEFFSVYMAQVQQRAPEEQQQANPSDPETDELRQWLDRFDAKLADLTARQDTFLRHLALRSSQ